MCRLQSKSMSKNASRSENRSARGGFTLIELLVVVAILSLLVSILIPALEKAKQVARQVQCQTTVRNLSLATVQYLHDNNGVYPFTYLSEPVHYALREYIKYHEDQVQWRASRNWLCPEVESSGGPDYGANVAFTRGTVGSPWASQSSRISSEKIPSPSMTIWIIEGGWRGAPGTYEFGSRVDFTATSDRFSYSASIPYNWQAFVWGPPWGVGMISYPTVSLRHNLMANATHADGHVEAMTYDTLEDSDRWLLPR
jgi:prepilin-type N-terminal cleavage/methylation domain-containing protein/prepilin-type processing-associated H-X9-DG protein